LSGITHRDNVVHRVVSLFRGLLFFNLWLYVFGFIKPIERMIIFKKKNAVIEFYDSIEEMPHRRYMKFNKEMMRQNEVGNSMTDVLKRIERAMSFINADSPDKAFKELSNARMSYNYANAELQPKGLALATMVRTIDGKEQNDITTDGLRRVLRMLQDLGITKKEVDQTTDEIKKKLNGNLKSSFLTNLREKILSIIPR